MNPIKALMGNKSLINVALGSVRDSMAKDGISCIVLQLDPTAEGDTPGLKIQSLAGPVGILTGADLDTVGKLLSESPEDVLQWCRIFETDLLGLPKTWPDFFRMKAEKEVPNV